VVVAVQEQSEQITLEQTGVQAASVHLLLHLGDLQQLLAKMLAVLFITLVVVAVVVTMSAQQPQAVQVVVVAAEHHQTR
jgi:hypothetical protein